MQHEPDEEVSWCDDVTFVNSPDGRLPTPGDDGDIMILRTPRSSRLDLGGEIVCDWRAGDVW